MDVMIYDRLVAMNLRSVWLGFCMKMLILTWVDLKLGLQATMNKAETFQTGNGIRLNRSGK